MRISVLCSIIFSLGLVFFAGCGGGLTPENKKLGEDYLSKGQAWIDEKDGKKKMEIGTEMIALGTKVAALKDDQKKAFDAHFKTKMEEFEKKKEKAK